MTEREFFVRTIPTIAEIIIECRKLSKKDYEDFKNTTIKDAPKTAKKNWYRSCLWLLSLSCKTCRKNKKKGGRICQK